MRRPHSFAARYQRGLTLIELMISVALGLFILAVTLSVFLGIARTSRTQDAASKLEDTGRFAIESVARVIRQAGYRNWGGPQNSPPGYDGTGDVVLEGSDGTTAGTNYSDSITVRFAGAGAAVGAADGSVVDCLGNPVAESSSMADHAVNTFAIATNGGVNELTCDMGGGAVTLASGVDGMQILYGLDLAGGDRVPDRWLPASAVGTQWDDVIAVRVSLMVVGDANSRGLQADSTVYSFFDSSYENDDDDGITYDASTATADARARLRKIYTTTIFLRNLTSADL